jgi:Ala-tRNA(Pro) deacylase
MAINERLRRFLDQAQVAYEVLPHREAFTAQEVAAAAHVSGRRLAKVLALREQGGGALMVVLPAACRLDLPALQHATGRHRLSLIGEDEMAALFPDCDTGAMPPFGNLYGMPVYVDGCFQLDQDILFQAGNHREVVRMPYAAYARLTRPEVGEYCLHEREKSVER